VIILVHKVIGFIKNKPVIIAAAVAVIVLAGLGIATISGLFQSSKTRTETNGDLPANQYISPVGQDGALVLGGKRVDITALDSDSLGVSPTSEFLVTFSAPTDEKDLATSLSISPSQPYQLKKISDKEYRINFDNPLEKDSIYRFVLSDKNSGEKQSWAFQTKKSLNVIRTLPRNKAVQVPVNSGIEITFSHENITNAEKYFSIEPETPGRFEMHGKTLVFVPEKLEEGTVYTVTIKKGIGVSGSEDTLANDYTFSFQTRLPETGQSNKKYFNFSDRLYNITPESVPLLEVYTDKNLVNSEISIELYSFPDAQSFLAELKKHQPKYSWAVTGNNQAEYNVSALNKAAEFKARIIQQHNMYWETNYLLLPSSLAEGYYLVKADVDGDSYFTQLQINKASVYIMATGEKSLAWLNDSTTGKPLSEAEFLLEGGEAVKADKDGMAVLNTALDSSPDAPDRYYIVRPKDGLEFIARIQSGYQPYYGYYYNSDITNNYWTYIYLDKGIYLPEDTVNIWGIIRPRDSSSSFSKATLELIRYDYSSDYDNNASVLNSCKVDISPNGTFTGSIKLSNYNPGSYEVRLRIDDKTLLTSYLSIMGYTKPTYKLEAVPDRTYIKLGEEVNFDIQASFFEGTPVSGIKVSYDAVMNGATLESGVLVSDASGSSKLTIKPGISDAGWRPLSLYVNFRNNEAEEQPINIYSYVPVFIKDTMIETEAESDGKTGKVTITTSRIDFSKLDANPSRNFYPDEYRGDPVDMPLKAKLYEKRYEARKTGDYYDYINKVRRDIYEYYEVQTLIGEYSFSTSGGKYELSCAIKDDKNYYLELYGHDSKGRPITETVYLYSWNYYSPYNTSTYSLTESGNYKQYMLGEKVTAEVKYNKEKPSRNNSCKYLFIRLKNGIIDYTIKDSPLYEFTFEENFVPNIHVKAVCFDGKDLYDAGIRQYTFDREERKLDIKIKADKDVYKPGDTVKLTLDVTDANGNPVSSDINVSVVDEAYFAIFEQYVDTLYGLYGPSVSSGIISDFISYSPDGRMGYPMAEGGEGGDWYVRKDFKDSAFFKTVTSGKNGKAEVSFKLPDNLTSWRITCQAVTGDLKAGNKKINISSRLPFFVNTIFSDIFIENDNPSILLRSYGTELLPGSQVNYKVILFSEGKSLKTINSKGIVNTITSVSLGNLPEGNYTIKIEAQSGNLKDALEQSFKVAGSLIETTVTDQIALSADTVLKSDTKGLTSVVFYGEDSSLLYRELHSLYRSWGERIDQKIARKVAAELLEKYFNEDFYISEDFDIKKYQTEDGGLALLSYDSSNPALSAKMCAFAADSVDHKSLSAYFYKLLEDGNTTHEDAAYALWGLAALKEPVLLDIYRAVDTQELPLQIKLILGNALAEIGDFRGAGDIYADVIKQSGKITGTFAYIENGTRDESIDSTALCTIIALRINTPEKMKLYNYIKSNSTSELLVNLERMIFVTNYIKEASLDSSFIYELDGIRKKIDLPKGSAYSLILTPDKLQKLKFYDVQGKVIAAVTYVAPVREAIASKDSLVSITREYSGGSGSGNTFKRSDTIKITITPKFSEAAPDGYYEITDILPAGFRFERSGSSVDIIHPDEITGQKIVFGFYYNKKRADVKKVEYYARAVSPGSYTADNAAIRHINSGVANFADKLSVSISER